ncbi:hypothetical protein NLU13_4099 [Sarocladium strictum]|uniref:Uncharacterized protein n=1 Tax=Sarocladium strictum TaxID=5046 RepID=A0AA39GJ19_SARSR|nr:hypothetical protein NLU13_4099 [Sarocladium strictum]
MAFPTSTNAGGWARSYIVRFSTEDHVKKALALDGAQKLDTGPEVFIRSAHRSKWNKQTPRNSCHESFYARNGNMRKVHPAHIAPSRSSSASTMPQTAQPRAGDVSEESSGPSTSLGQAVSIGIDHGQASLKRQGLITISDSDQNNEREPAGSPESKAQPVLIEGTDTVPDSQSTAASELDVKTVRKARSCGRDTVSRTTEAAKWDSDGCGKDMKRDSREEVPAGNPSQALGRDGSLAKKVKQKDRTPLQVDYPGDMTDDIAFPKLEKPKHAISGKTKNDDSSLGAEHKRTASIFSEAEITERKKAWNKIAMPLDLQKRATQKRDLLPTGGAKKGVKPKL